MIWITTDAIINKIYLYIQDPLHKNSIYLITNGIVVSLLGFFFWTITAKFYNPAEVGLAATIISATGLIILLSNTGFRFALIRFLSTSTEKSKEIINSCFTISGVFSIILAIIFLVGLEFFSPALLFIRSNIFFASLFILFTLLFNISELQDSVFIGIRQTRYVLIKNTISGIFRIPLPFFLVAFGAFGIFSSYGIAFIIALIFSTFFFMPKIISEYFPIPTIEKSIMNDILHFSFWNHIAELMRAASPLILSLMITIILGPEMTAYFYITWMIASILFLIPGAISSSLLAEGANDPTNLHQNVNKAIKFIIILLIPLIICIFIIGEKILLLFGEEYAKNAVEMLWILGLSSIPVSLNGIYVTVKRIQIKIVSIIFINMFILFSTLTISYILMIRIGLVAVGVAWIITHGVLNIIIGLFIVKNSIIPLLVLKLRKF